MMCQGWGKDEILRRIAAVDYQQYKVMADCLQQDFF